MTPVRMKFGIFMAPFHRIGENPTLSLERDMQLIQWLDELGYDEAWVGEHHSTGWEIIGSPEVFIAAAAERTRHIRLGTGVVSLPYHHPLMVADRMVQLDHMTRGRVMLGVGPGAIASDAYMMGIEAVTQRQRMDEALEAITALLRYEEPVSRKTDWFTLQEARLQLRPFTQPRFPIAVASTVSPAGRTMAGKYGLGLLSVVLPGQVNELGNHWATVEEAASKHGKTVQRSEWRLVLPFYLAESREEAFNDIRAGHRDWTKEYLQETLGFAPDPDGDDIEVTVKKGGAIVGTPADAVEAITRMQKLAGGFGGLLGMVHEWAPREKILKSWEFMARYVAPNFQGQIDTLRSSAQFVAEKKLTPSFLRPEVLAKAYQDAGLDVPAEIAAAKRKESD